TSVPCPAVVSKRTTRGGESSNRGSTKEKLETILSKQASLVSLTAAPGWKLTKVIPKDRQSWISCCMQIRLFSRISGLGAPGLIK
ncbi:hypothetical protein CP061683_0087B, partial [Chlamydia psittaci 06-1683]